MFKMFNLLMMGRLIVRNAIVIVMVALCVHTAKADTVSYGASLNTSALIGDPAGPFSVAFQLSDGSGLGDGLNTISISGFDFGGGAVIGTPTVLGGASGSLSSAVTLTDALFLNLFIQEFTPGSYLAFVVTTTTNIDTQGPPDEFDFSILDNTEQQLPTQTGQPFYDPFVAVIIDSSNPTLQTFPSDPTQAPAGGGQPLTIPAPTAALVPEPNSALLLTIVACILGIKRKLPKV